MAQFVCDLAGRFRAGIEREFEKGNAGEITDHAHAALREAAADIGERAGERPDEAMLRDSPHIWIGSLDELTEKAHRLRSELGITSLMLGEVDELAALVARLSGP